MKLLMVSKALVSAAYRRKLVELARLDVHVVAVVPPAWKEGGTEVRLEPGGRQDYELLVSPIRWNGHFHLHYYPQLPAILRTVRPDLLHFDEEPYNLATYQAARAARKAGVPLVFFTWQNLIRAYPPPFSWMERHVYRSAAAGIAGSVEACNVLRAKGYGGRLAVVPQFGVDPVELSPCRSIKPEGPCTIGFLNRLIPGKAPMLAIKALQRLPNDCRLLIVGDGPLRSEVQLEVARRGLESRVEMRPRVPSSEMPALYRSLDAVILPSITTSSWKEQFGRVLIEAMACGVPVVGSNSGEIPHVIGDAGLVVPEGDAAALAAALTLLHDHAELRADMARRGRQRVLEMFTHEQVARRTTELYREVLEAGNADWD